MAHFGDGVEQALHYLLRLECKDSAAPSARDAAEFYGQSSSSAAKLFTKLEKAGLVIAAEGREGGFRLARPLADISLLDVADAVEGRKPLFLCKNIRTHCAAFEGSPPDWATTGLCAIHAAMIEAEKAMRDNLAATTLREIADRAGAHIPAAFGKQATDWFAQRRRERRLPKRTTAKPSRSRST